VTDESLWMMTIWIGIGRKIGRKKERKEIELI
jgi:hypothetical protein